MCSSFSPWEEGKYTSVERIRRQKLCLSYLHLISSLPLRGTRPGKKEARDHFQQSNQKGTSSKLSILQSATYSGHRPFWNPPGERVALTDTSPPCLKDWSEEQSLKGHCRASALTPGHAHRQQNSLWQLTARSTGTCHHGQLHAESCIFSCR